MDLQTLKKLFPNASKSTIRANVGFVGAVETESPKRAPIQALVRSVQKPESGKASLEIRIVCIAMRCRLLDRHDAVAYACKPLTDAIAETLGCDDADPRLRWEYHQLKTEGPQGTIVLITVQ